MVEHAWYKQQHPGPYNNYVLSFNLLTINLCFSELEEDRNVLLTDSGNDEPPPVPQQPFMIEPIPPNIK